MLSERRLDGQIRFRRGSCHQPDVSEAWRGFCRQVEALFECTESRGRNMGRPGVSHGAVAFPKALVQCRCRSMIGAEFESRYRNYWAKHRSVSGLMASCFSHGSRSKSKNRDKQITFIVRVSNSLFYCKTFFI